MKASSQRGASRWATVRKRIKEGYCRTCPNKRGKAGTKQHCRQCADKHNALLRKRYFDMRDALRANGARQPDA